MRWQYVSIKRNLLVDKKPGDFFVFILHNMGTKDIRRILSNGVNVKKYLKKMRKCIANNTVEVLYLYCKQYSLPSKASKEGAG